jgi:hypothetical protein
MPFALDGLFGFGGKAPGIRGSVIAAGRGFFGNRQGGALASEQRHNLSVPQVETYCKRRRVCGAKIDEKFTFKGGICGEKDGWSDKSAANGSTTRDECGRRSLAFEDVGGAGVGAGGFVVSTGGFVADVFGEAGFGDVFFGEEFLGVAGSVLGGEVGGFVNAAQGAAGVGVVGEGGSGHRLLDFEEFSVGAVVEDFLVEVNRHGETGKFKI